MKIPQRDHLAILNEIDEKLSCFGFHEAQQTLKEEVRASFSGSELCLRSGSQLLKLTKDQAVKDVIGKLVDEFIEYCRFNGLEPH